MEKHSIPRPGQSGSEHQRLKVFLGNWTAEGTLANGSAIALTEDCDWLPGAGSFFIMQREEMRIGHDSFRTTRVVGYDRDAQVYDVHHFDSHGHARIYRGAEREGVWTLSGQQERATFVLDADGGSFTAKWEQRGPDGSSWLPLCEFRTRKSR